jgi:hypothetical protein
VCPLFLPADEDESSFTISHKFVIVKVYHTVTEDLDPHTMWLPVTSVLPVHQRNGWGAGLGISCGAVNRG